jgi:hypothetical protein
MIFVKALTRGPEPDGLYQPLVACSSQVSASRRPHETLRRSGNLSLRRSRLLSRRRSDRINKQLRHRALPRLQSKSFGSVRSCLQEVRPWCHDHLHNVVHAKGRTLRTHRARLQLSAAYPQSEKREYGQSDSGLLRTNSQAAWASDETIFQSLRSRPEIITR